jgi:hypothetical protein
MKLTRRPAASAIRCDALGERSRNPSRLRRVIEVIEQRLTKKKNEV